MPCCSPSCSQAWPDALTCVGDRRIEVQVPSMRRSCPADARSSRSETASVGHADAHPQSKLGAPIAFFLGKRSSAPTCLPQCLKPYLAGRTKSAKSLRSQRRRFRPALAALSVVHTQSRCCHHRCFNGRPALDLKSISQTIDILNGRSLSARK